MIIDALFEKWWRYWRDRDAQFVRDCLRIALGDRWDGLVTAAMERNGQVGRTPASGRALASALGCNPGTICRLRNGDQTPNLVIALELCKLLDIAVGDFYPELEEWLEDATVVLCDPNVNIDLASAYVTYCTHLENEGGAEIDGRAVAAAAARMRWDVVHTEEAIRQVADEVTHAFDQETFARRGPGNGQ